jgi:hypothetical protein
MFVWHFFAAFQAVERFVVTEGREIEPHGLSPSAALKPLTQVIFTFEVAIRAGKSMLPSPPWPSGRETLANNARSIGTRFCKIPARTRWIGPDWTRGSFRTALIFARKCNCSQAIRLAPVRLLRRSRLRRWPVQLPFCEKPVPLKPTRQMSGFSTSRVAGGAAKRWHAAGKSALRERKKHRRQQAGAAGTRAVLG